jgi:hypothetical protein
MEGTDPVAAVITPRFPDNAFAVTIGEGEPIVLEPVAAVVRDIGYRMQYAAHRPKGPGKGVRDLEVGDRSIREVVRISFHDL